MQSALVSADSLTRSIKNGKMCHSGFTCYLLGKRMKLKCNFLFFFSLGELVCDQSVTYERITVALESKLTASSRQRHSLNELNLLLVKRYLSVEQVLCEIFNNNKTLWFSGILFSDL